MTNREAIGLLRRLQEPEPYEPQLTQKMYDALEMAIGALSQPNAHNTLDCISRQAAIDAIRKDMYADKDWMSAVICDGIEQVLKQLPSAEPDTPMRGSNVAETAEKTTDRPTGDCISRQAAIEAVRKAKDKSEAHRRMVQLPSAEERKTGRWETVTDPLWAGGGYWKCSNCGYGFSFGAYHEADEWDYCPACGARMKVGA